MHNQAEFTVVGSGKLFFKGAIRFTRIPRKKEFGIIKSPLDFLKSKPRNRKSNDDLIWREILVVTFANFGAEVSL
ncbi:hypothetical protein CH370_15965 [Leptospira kmetyi]|uniref:Uncharacterized protein n=1 Tax=Leptospira kmetyi TaxID=408139 RepID=A0AAD0UQH3_9LEPT|nr:hypothetical protein EFP84_01285 [Leptospira kmetyi]EQA51937.1 hypothetical protein LEP1GSC052_1326 [Leptospira kmetyi serovar Malaysia str. Bejo-Iso9]PJZ28650.1 hypothetical protein CH378_16950 [Leptospira kmetyi]PJZ40407.1 hypothetical protein CH370_15965 [Leptospira kmetyi]